MPIENSKQYSMEIFVSKDKGLFQGLDKEFLQINKIKDKGRMLLKDTQSLDNTKLLKLNLIRIQQSMHLNNQISVQVLNNNCSKETSKLVDKHHHRSQVFKHSKGRE